MEVSIETQKQKERFRPFKLVIDIKNKKEAKNLYSLFNIRELSDIYNTRTIWEELDTINNFELYDRRLFTKNLRRLKKEINS